MTKENKKRRLASLDAFRGFVILTMVFVNYLPGMPGVPEWLLHVPAGVDGYTLTDLVFPGFLFIVGVAIPLAFERRMSTGISFRKLVPHILSRGAVLIFLGVVMASSERYAEEHTLLSRSVWNMLFFIAVILLWNHYQKGTEPQRRLAWILRAIGLMMVLVLLPLLRTTTGDGEIAWLQTSYWGILGIIGWAYLNSSLCYLLLRGDRVYLMGLFFLMIALWVGDHHGLLAFLGPIREYVHVGSMFGTHSAIVIAGTLVGSCFTSSANISEPNRIRFMALFGAGLWLAGTLIRPLHGISKIGATDAFALVASGICCVLLLLFYSLIDSFKVKRWAGFLQPVGANPLLAYILPSILGGMMALTNSWSLFWPFWPSGGILGIANAVAITALVLLFTWWLTRIGVLLRL
ncbi:MAG: DUF5009 domain-containing protein [Acidobacteriota bacterium]|nr:MAG: DUF5009 domain-containing protein [Acidobacteriota bacterium]